MAEGNHHHDFTPKQVAALNTPAGYDLTGGFVTSQYARKCIQLAPPVTSASIVHDNACGTGQVTLAILASDHSVSPKIHATDINQSYIAALQNKISKIAPPNHLPDVSTGTDRSEELTSFKANTFTHSFDNFAIFMTPNGGIDAAKETYRTLQPGGVAVLTCWRTISWLMPTMAVHMATRPNLPPTKPQYDWRDGTHLVGILKDAGFSDVRAEVAEAVAETCLDGLRDWAETAWAILGGVVGGGWKEGDEEGWDAAVDLYVEKLRAAEGITVTDDGMVRMGCSANVVVARK